MPCPLWHALLVSLAAATLAGCSRPPAAAPLARIVARDYAHQAPEIDWYRLPPGGTVRGYMDWLEAGEKGEPPATPVGGIGEIAPGREVWMPLRLSTGKYFIICQVKDTGDGLPHYHHGMFNQFEVQ